MEANWVNMNKGRIPGLTGKVQYPHPFIQKFQQKQNKNLESLIHAMVRHEPVKKSSSREKDKDKHKKKHRSKSRSES